MTMTKKGVVNAQPEQPELQPEVIRHPNWPFHKVPMANPYPDGPRFIHNCKSKRPVDQPKVAS
jgi:hypothetical protein